MSFLFSVIYFLFSSLPLHFLIYSLLFSNYYLHQLPILATYITQHPLYSIRYTHLLLSIMPGAHAGTEMDIDTHIITLTRFLTEEQVKHKEATGDFTYDVTCLSFLASLWYHGC